MGRSLPSKEKFETKFIPEPMSGCWIWIKSVDRHGYGRVGSQRANRVAWIIYRGEIPYGFHACHACDNPSCVNPNHLFLGRPKDNYYDSKRKMRHTHGEKQGLAKLTDEAVLDIRTRRLSQKQFADLYGVSGVAVGFAQRRVTWKHLP